MQPENTPLNDRQDLNASSEQNPATDAPQFRNDGSDYRQDANARTTDRLEGMSASAAPLLDLPDSPTSASDAGLSDAAFDPQSGAGKGARDLAGLAGAPLDDELTDELEDADLNEGLPDNPREIPMTDLADDENPIMSVRSPEMSDLNVPGEIDIEELDAAALSDTDIPRDALLDPIEE